MQRSHRVSGLVHPVAHRPLSGLPIERAHSFLRHELEQAGRLTLTVLPVPASQRRRLRWARSGRTEPGPRTVRPIEGHRHGLMVPALVDGPADRSGAVGLERHRLQATLADRDLGQGLPRSERGKVMLDSLHATGLEAGQEPTQAPPDALKLLTGLGKGHRQIEADLVLHGSTFMCLADAQDLSMGKRLEDRPLENGVRLQ